MYRLLIVDDEKNEREGMANFIDWGKYGIEMVGTARNGQEAIERIERVRPDIVLTDIKMPVMDGIELIKEAKKRWNNITFAVLSGYGEYEYTSRAMREGVKYYILKPCSEAQIAEVIKDIVSEKKEHEKKEKVYGHIEKIIELADSTDEGFIDKIKNENRVKYLMDYNKVRESDSYNAVLFELYLAFVKLDIMGYSNEKKKQMAQVILRILYNEDIQITGDDFLFDTYKEIRIRNEKLQSSNPDRLRIESIIVEAYKNIMNPELNIKYISKKLFMNEDYFGRLFHKLRGEKFQDFIQTARVGIAMGVLRSTPEIKLVDITKYIGYPPDGQQFSKAFKKRTGLSPSDFREKYLRRKALEV